MSAVRGRLPSVFSPNSKPATSQSGQNQRSPTANHQILFIEEVLVIFQTNCYTMLSVVVMSSSISL
jgi:hypothetical protein